MENLDKKKLDEFGAKWTSEFNKVEINRKIHDEWLNSLRQIKGYHDPDITFEENESKIYSHYTRRKVVPLIAKLNQSLLRTKEKNWNITPTPKPTISDNDLMQIAKSLVRQDEQGSPILPTDKALNKAIYVFTEEKAKNMARVMNDQHVESKRNKIQKKIIWNMVVYGTGIEKGPLTYSKSRYEVKDGKGLQTVQYLPNSVFVSLWRAFPDMDATEIEDCNYFYELHSQTKHQMFKMLKQEYYFGDVIQEILSQNKEGNYEMRNWENTMRGLDENRDDSKSGASKNYEVVERNGYIDTEDLIEIGLLEEEERELKEHHLCQALICDGKIIKIIVYPIFDDLSELYHFGYYEKDETSIFGIGLPKIIRDRQLTVNAGERNLLRHGAWLTEPCGEINKNKLDPISASVADKFGPGMFLATQGEDRGKAIDQYYMQNNSASLIGIINFLMTQGDFESSLPSSLFGVQSASLEETAKAFSGRMANLIDFIKDIARNFDEANVSYLQSQYKWNMKYNPDNGIKGDLSIEAIGSVAALIKSILVENIGFILQSMPQEIKERTKMYEFAKELYGAFFENPEKFLMDDEEYEQKAAPMVKKQEEIMALQTEMQKVKAMLDVAKADNVKARSEKTRADIPIKQAEKQVDIEQKKVETIKGIKEIQEQGGGQVL